jgi:hypothetical protein
VSRIAPPDDDFAEWANRSFLRWQRCEEKKDGLSQARHNKLIIENGDPETEAAVTALEQGWNEGR